jgi:hypothetical protein
LHVAFTQQKSHPLNDIPSRHKPTLKNLVCGQNANRLISVQIFSGAFIIQRHLQCAPDPVKTGRLKTQPQPARLRKSRDLDKLAKEVERLTREVEQITNAINAHYTKMDELGGGHFASPVRKAQKRGPRPRRKRARPGGQN